MTDQPRDRLLQAELLRNVAAALQARGHTVRTVEKQVQPGNLPEGTLVTVVELHVTDEFGEFHWWLNAEVNEQREKISSWRTKGNGKYYVSLGAYGDRKTLFLGKKGWNMEGIVDHAEHELRATLRRRRVDIVTARNQGALERVRAETGLRPYGAVDVSASGDPAKPVKVTLKGERSLTEEQAVALVKALKDLGIW